LNPFPLQSPYGNPLNRESTLQAIGLLARTSNGIETIRKVRKNWSKKIYADRKENQVITFTLNPSAIHRFDELRGNSPRRDTLEWLIRRWGNIESELREARKKELKEEKDRLRAKWERKRPFDPLENLNNIEIKKLRSNLSQLQETFNRLLFENAQLNELVKSHDLDTNHLTTKQQIEIQDRYEKQVKYHNNSRNTSTKD